MCALRTPQPAVTTVTVAHCNPDRYHSQQGIKRDVEGVIEGFIEGVSVINTTWGGYVSAAPG